MRLTVKETAKLLDTTPYTVQNGVRTGQLPIGTAIKQSKVYTYLIYPDRVAELLGKPVTQIEDIVKEWRETR